MSGPDIVERLLRRWPGNGKYPNPDGPDAAATITALRAEVERKDAALRNIKYEAERDGVDFVGANTLPTEYVRWLSSIEVDVRVHDLTADEVARLVAAVAPERDAVEGAVEALEARVAKLREALEPLACLGIPTKPQGNAGFYSIYHKHIIAARAAIGGEA